MKKRPEIILLTLALLLTLVPALSAQTSAAAEDTAATEVWIADGGGARKLTVRTEVQGKYIFWKDDSYALPVLEIVGDISGDMYQFADTYKTKEYAAIWANGDLIIRISKADALSVSGTPGDDATAVYGVYVDGDLTIQGGPGLSRSVTVRAPEGESASVGWSVSAAICCTGGLTVERNCPDLTVNAAGGPAIRRSMGVKADGVTVRSGTLTATGGTSTATGNVDPTFKFDFGSHGIWTGDLTVISGKVTAKGGGGASSSAYSCGILALGNMTLASTGSNDFVSAEGGAAFYSRGILTQGDLTSSCRSLTARGGDNTALNKYFDSTGIEAYKKDNNGKVLTCCVTVTSGTVTAMGGKSHHSYGIRTCGLNGNLTVSGAAVVNASGADNCDGESVGVTTDRNGCVKVETTGAGKLTAAGGDLSMRSLGVDAGDVSVKSGALEARGGDCADYSGAYSYSAGISLNGEDDTSTIYNIFSLNGGSVTAEGGSAKTKSTGVQISKGTFNANEGTAVIKGGTAPQSYGLECNIQQHIDLRWGSKLPTLTFFGYTRAFEVYDRVVGGTVATMDYPCLLAPIILAGEDSKSATLRPYGGQYIGYAHYNDSDNIYNCQYVLAGPDGTGGRKTSEVPKRDISGVTPKLDNNSFTYDGTEKTKTITSSIVLGGENILKYATVTGNRGTNAGTYYLTVRANADSHYTGSKVETWVIKRKQVDAENIKVTVEGGPYVYTGRAIRPTLTVRYVNYGYTTLKTTDYSVTLANNFQAGTASVSVTQGYSGNYSWTGSVSATFEIIKAENPIKTGTAVFCKPGGTLDLSAAVSGAQGAVTYAITGGTLGCSVSGGVFTAGSAEGTVMVTVTAAGNENYEGGSTVVNVVVSNSAFTACVVGATLAWRAELPETGGSVVVIAAWYDESGMMLGATTKTLTGSGTASGELDVDADAAAYKLMLVNGENFAPLCEAWNS